MATSRSVPLSQSPGVGQRDSIPQERDSQRDSSGTPSLKVLALKVLSRDTDRDSGGTAAEIACPTVRDSGTPAGTADVSPGWVEGAARLQSMPCPSSVEDRRWRRLIADTAKFLDQGWAAKASALGWAAADLWGCHPRHPMQRLDLAGALWLLGGDEITTISDNTITTRRSRTGSALTIYRRPPQSRDPVCTAWELGMRGNT